MLPELLGLISWMLGLMLLILAIRVTWIYYTRPLDYIRSRIFLSYQRFHSGFRLGMLVLLGCLLSWLCFCMVHSQRIFSLDSEFLLYGIFAYVFSMAGIYYLWLVLSSLR